MPKKRNFSRRERTQLHRDARLIVIATEGTHTEKQYFQALIKTHRNSSVKVKILERASTASSPETVREQMDQFVEDYALSIDEGDELWLVIDVDKWNKTGGLSNIAAECLQKSYSLAVSNPCFEIWLVLHHKAVSDFTNDEKSQLFENKRVNENRRYIENTLLNLLGSYNKTNLNTDDFIPHIDAAIKNAKVIDVNPVDRWTQDLGTRVYLLVESILGKK